MAKDLALEAFSEARIIQLFIPVVEIFLFLVILGSRVDRIMHNVYELHWLPIQSRIKFKLCLLVHHVIGGRSPPYISELVTPVAAIPGRASLRSVGRQELDVPRTRLVSSERAFEVAAPKAWNKLPVDIKSTRDTGLFKKQLKTFLFRAAYPYLAS